MSITLPKFKVIIKLIKLLHKYIDLLSFLNIDDLQIVPNTLKYKCMGQHWHDKCILSFAILVKNLRWATITPTHGVIVAPEICSINVN